MYYVTSNNTVTILPFEYHICTLVPTSYYIIQGS